MIKINKPKFDLRNLVGGTLDNGVKYSLIHDETLEKSYVTVAVNVGSHSNPKGYDGLAHFLEHMLFMGSKKYPGEEHYFDELNKLGGYSNAYTDSMETVYYFNVFDDGLENMFDIFSRFFIDPLFKKDSIEREINAVDNEHKKNINSDMWRKQQFMTDLLNKDTSMNNFGTGSLNTLKKDNIRDVLIDFYKKHYTTDNISICIASSKPIVELKGIIDTTFGNIAESKCVNKLEFNKNFYSENNLNTYYLKTLSNIYNVSYIFEIPVQSEYVHTKFFFVFETMLLNKSDKSLYFDLTRKGYLNNIDVDITFEGVFEIILNLTKHGLDNLAYVESALYKTIEQINNSDIQSYAKYLKEILEKNYDTIHKFETTDLCNMLAVNHYYCDTKDIFNNDFSIREIKKTIEYKNTFIKYINNKNVIKIISCPEYPYGQKITLKKAREYNTEYALIKLKLKSVPVNNISFNLSDLQNEYLNGVPVLIDELDAYDVPTLITQNQWYGGCSKFGEPLVSILLQINNEYYNTAIKYILTKISCIILNYIINIKMHKLFQLPYSISFNAMPSTSSININISALNDVSKIQLLLKELKEFLFNIDITVLTELYVNNLMISLQESYENIKFSNPSNYSNNVLKSTIYDTEYPTKTLIDAIKIIDFNQIIKHMKKILDGSTMTSLIYGNIDKKNINGLLDSYKEYFNNSEIIVPIVQDIQQICVKHLNPNEKANCVTLFYSMGRLDIINEKDAIKNILAIIGTRILSQPFFDELRTKKQFGYLVNMGMSVYRNNYYVTQKIQSNKPIKDIIDNIIEFNKSINKYFKSDSTFKSFINSIKKELMEPDYSLSDKISKYLPEIINHEYVFNRNIILFKQIDKITKKCVNSYFNHLLSKPIKIIIKGQK